MTDREHDNPEESSWQQPEGALHDAEEETPPLTEEPPAQESHAEVNYEVHEGEVDQAFDAMEESDPEASQEIVNPYETPGYQGPEYENPEYAEQEHIEQPSEETPAEQAQQEYSEEYSDPNTALGEGERDSMGDLLEEVYIIEEGGENLSPEELEVHSIDAESPLEDEEPVTEDMVPISVGLGEGTDEIPEELDFEEEEDYEDEPAGMPMKYKVAAMAAGLVCLLIFGAVYVKFQSREPDPADAFAMAQPTPAPGPKTPAPEPEPILEFSTLDDAPEAVRDRMLAKQMEVIVEPPVMEPTEPILTETPESEVLGETLVEEPIILEGEGPHTPAVRPGLTEILDGPVKRGFAMVTMRNGNLFHGKIMKIKEDGYLLYVPEGEIFLFKAEIAKVVPAGATPEFENYPQGYLELNNGKRLWGHIFNKTDKTVTFGDAQSKVQIPRSKVKKISTGPAYEVKIR